jgi:hypothetical protein
VVVGADSVRQPVVTSLVIGHLKSRLYGGRENHTSGRFATAKQRLVRAKKNLWYHFAVTKKTARHSGGDVVGGAALPGSADKDLASRPWFFDRATDQLKRVYPSAAAISPADSSKLSAVALDIDSTDPKHATTINDNSTAYSTAVGPSSSRSSFRKKLIIVASLFSGELLLQVPAHGIHQGRAISSPEA